MFYYYSDFYYFVDYDLDSNLLLLNVTHFFHFDFYLTFSFALKINYLFNFFNFIIKFVFISISSLENFN